MKLEQTHKKTIWFQLKNSFILISPQIAKHSCVIRLGNEYLFNNKYFSLHFQSTSISEQMCYKMCHGTTLLRFIKQMKIKLLAKLVAGMIIVSRMGMKRWQTNLLCNYSDLLVCSRCLAAVNRAAEGKDVIKYVKVYVIFNSATFNKPDIFEVQRLDSSYTSSFYQT